MASAPERISIKRRRDEEPVEALVLTHSKKQRVSDHVFIRLNPYNNTPLPSIHSSGTHHQLNHSHNTLRDAHGIPIVMTTAAGEESRDFERYRNTQNARARPVQTNELGHHRLTSISSLLKQQAQPSPETRTFHLTRELIAGLRPRSVKSDKSQSSLRPHLPTFIERPQTRSATVVPPVPDKLITSDSDTTPVVVSQSIQDKSKRTGRSIYDDPLTWDLESDELADQLAAIAFEIDPSTGPPPPPAIDKVGNPADKTAGIQDFIFETYVRVHKDVDVDTEMIDASNLGYLVIDEEDEALWEQYLKDDDEDDDDSWDEEDQDSNAEDNPRNDYPEDEISSDDEYGRNPYQHRRYASGDEEYTEADDDH